MAQKNKPQAETLYGSPQPNFTNFAPKTIKARRAPTTEDTGYDLGQSWLDTVGDDFYILADVTAGVATWDLLGTNSGPLNTLTGNTGGAISPSAGNINILGNDLVSVAGSGSTLTLTIGDGGYPISPFIVGSASTAGYQTIQSAINAAQSAGSGTVYVQPGTYTENLTLVSGINVVGSIYGNTTIVGVHTPPASGSFTFQNLTLQSATHIFSSAVAGSTQIVVEHSVVTVTNGFVFNLANWTGALIISDTDANGTNDGIVNNTGGATIILHTSTIGVGTGQTMVASGGVVEILETQINCPVTFGGAGSVIIDAGCSFLRTVTTANSSAVTITNSNFSTGSSTAISHGSSGALKLGSVVIDSSANPVIAGAGAGVLTMTSVSFPTSSNLAGTLTTAAGKIRGGNFISQYVVGSSPDAQYQTIQSAITAAAAAGGNATVYVKPGTYTESLTLSSTVDIVGSIFSGVTITGVHTPPASGSVTFQNVTLTSATHILSSAVAGSTQIVIEHSVVTVTNGYVFNLLNWTGQLIISDTDSNGTNDGIVNNTGGATVVLHTSTLGVGTGNSMVASGGLVEILECQIDCPVTFGGAGTVVIDAGCSFSQTVTTANSATMAVTASNFFTGASAAISHGSSGVASLSDVTINSSANPCIAGAGAGVLTLGSVTFLNNSATAGTLTLAYGTLGVGTIKTSNAAIAMLSGTGTINISTDATATTVNVGTGASTKACTFGSSSGTASTTLQSGTLGLNINSNSGDLAIVSGTGAFNVSADAANTTLSIGTGAAVKTITIGSTNTTSATNLTAGSGGVNCATNFALTSVATKISLNGGAATDFIGQATLTNGTVTVSNTNIAATDRIFVNRSAVNASSALGLFKTVITGATNFVITACKPADATTETGDASTVDYIIFRQT